MKNVEKTLKIYLMIISCFFLASCGDDFPSEELFHVDINKGICDRYILDKSQIKIKFDKAIPIEQCPDTIGFTKGDAAKVLNWSRRMKKKLQECQQ